MAITRGTAVGVDYATIANSTAGTAATVSKTSTLNNGDVYVANVGVGVNNATITPPSGWSLVPGTAVTNMPSGTKTEAVYYKVITNAAGEPASYTWTVTSAKNSVILARYVGVDNTTPWDVNASTTQATGSDALASITTVTANARVLSVATGDADTAATLTQPTQQTLLVQVAGVRSGLADETLATAGATGTRTWTISTNTLGITGVLGALRPAAAAAAGAPASVYRPLRQAVNRAGSY